MTCTRIVLFLAASFVVANGRLVNNNFEAAKPGSCPRTPSANTCWNRCLGDGECRGAEKCCPTKCGGTVCSVPVTEKPGVCPATATGVWTCSSTCSSDDHCEGTKKCCKNRCGALACQIPEISEKPFEGSDVVDYELYEHYDN